MRWQEIEQRLKSYQPKSNKVPKSLKEAAVLIPILRKEEPEIILTVRANDLSTHQGEVAFPGGKRDKTDLDLVQTALRESYEEIALAPDNVKIIGSLQTLVSKHCLAVKPFVGFVNEPFLYQISVNETAHVFTVPLAFFKNLQQTVTHRIDCFDVNWYVPCYQYEQFKIWGLTAIMIVELVNLLFDTDIPLHSESKNMKIINAP